MTFFLDFIIPGKPVPKGRPRAAVIKGRAVLYTPKSTVSWEEFVGSCARAALADNPQTAALGEFKFGTDDLLALDVSVYVPRPKALFSKVVKEGSIFHLQYAPSGADLDNILKSVADGLQRCGIVPNDSRFVNVRAARYFSQSETNEHYTEVTITRQ